MALIDKSRSNCHIDSTCGERPAAKSNDLNIELPACVTVSSAALIPSSVPFS